jgi:predicted AAA+ superfamily ATPase
LLIYRVSFFSTLGKRILNTSCKYYSVDTGIKNAQRDFKILNIGSQIENIVYIELLRREYDVAVGKLYDGREIDFIATKFDETLYIQVTENALSTPELVKREIGNLQSLKSNKQKIVLSLYDATHETENGIKIINLID